MGGGAAYSNYDQAYRYSQRIPAAGIISDKTAAAVGAVGLRAAVTEGPVEAAGGL